MADPSLQVIRPNQKAGTTGVIQLTTTAQLLLAPPATNATRVLAPSSVICNYGGTDTGYYLYLQVGDGSAGAAGNSNVIRNNVTVKGNETASVGEIVIPSGYTLWGKASANSQLNFLGQFSTED